MVWKEEKMTDITFGKKRIKKKDLRKDIIKSLEGTDKVKIYAEEGDDFQQYVYDDGTKVKQGTLVGWETTDKHRTEFKIKKGINLSSD
jgi:hypothetical protein